MISLTGTARPWDSIARSRCMPTQERGRICASLDCDTVLSIYNPSEHCTMHAREAPNTRSRVRERTVREATCDHCGAVFATTIRVQRYCSDRCRLAAFARRRRALLRDERLAKQIG